jgi:uncharacterized protein (TIGR02996 family)
MMARPRTPITDAPYPPGWEPFLAAINEHLGADAPRLVFADWLQENGDEARAEFIRIQCALEHVHARWEDLASAREMFPEARGREYLQPLPDRLADPERWLISDEHLEAVLRQRELLSANVRRWAPFPEWTERAVGTFRRGFMCVFFPSAKQWLQDGEQIRRLTPVEELLISRTSGHAQQLFREPSVLGLARLFLPDLDSAGANLLADAPVLDSLAELGISKLGRWCLSPEAASALVASPRLSNLRSLSVSSNYAGDAVATTLVNTPHIRALEELQLPCTALGSKPFVALVRSPRFRQLRRLNVQGNGLGDADVRALVNSGLNRLEALNLRYNGLTQKSARLLARWPGLRTIRTLQLAGGQFGHDGIRELLMSEHLTNVTSLELPRWEIRKRDMVALTALPALQRIRSVTFAS